MGYPKLLAPMRQRLEEVLKHLVLDKEVTINENPLDVNLIEW